MFVIADSLTNDPVLMTGGKRKDLRTCEVRISIGLLLIGLNMSADLNKYKTFPDLQKVLEYSFEEIAEIFH